MHRVFVYGTLKIGEPNHNWFKKDVNGIYKLLGEARTVEEYPLIIGTKYNVPFLLYCPGKGHRVYGELYEVDDRVFKNLDELEDHPNFYIREVKNVQLNEDDRIVQAWIYFIKKFKNDLLKNPTIQNYSTNGPHGLPYVLRHERKKDYNYKIEILNCSDKSTIDDLNS